LKRYNTRVTDASLPLLASFKQLKRLNLGGTQVTASGVALLREKLPTVRIGIHSPTEPQDTVASR
jgi:hypothetical protein